MRPHGKPSELESRRLQGIQLYELGWAQVDIAEELKVVGSTVSKWVRAYKSAGIEGIKAKPASGRPPKLSEKNKKALVPMLIKGAKSQGFPNDLWTCPRIARLIREKFKVEYHVDHIPRLMRSLGFSPSEASEKGRRAG